MRVLFVTSECYPLVKTGGLADVSAALPPALINAGVDVRMLLPGYPAVLEGLIEPREVVGASLDLPGGASGRLLVGRKADGVTTYVLDAPTLFRRNGNPYIGPDGLDWPDNALRFAALAWTAALFAADDAADPWWQPDVLHGHDWQAGLIPAYLALRPDRFGHGPRPGTVMTIHNIAYQGNFGAWMLGELGLPSSSFQVNGVEYYGGISFLKAGCYYAGRLTTVSPTYADEIQTDEHGMGLQGLLASRADQLTGILNGVDYEIWDPAVDPHLVAPYRSFDLGGKARCKEDLQTAFGLERRSDATLAAVVSRLTWHKGLDLVMEEAPDWVARGGQLAVLGSGEPGLEQAFRTLATTYPGQVSVRIGYDEPLAHRLQAGADLLLVPSRSEPCGLTQLYALKYGTLPVVRRTGGLADTIVDANPAALADDSATGFQFVNANPQELRWALRKALALHARPERWRNAVNRAMSRDFSWERPAEEYRDLYRGLAPKAD